MKSKNKALTVRKLFVSLIPIFLGLIAGAIFMAFAGANPIEGFSYLFKGGLMSVERICNTIAYAVPLMLTGMSIAFAFRTNLFNIGVVGQFLIGGLCGTMLALSISLPRPIMILAMIAAGIIGGMLWALVPGVLKTIFNVNEVVSGIMLNWTAYWIVYIVISDYFKSPIKDIESRTIPVGASLKIERLTELTHGSQINIGIIFVLIAVAIITFILKRTVLGYEMKAVGYNRFTAEYGGINVNKNTIISMIIAGALAGLSGITFYAGYVSNMQIGVMPTQGFDGIAVSLLAANSPIGCIFSALFLAVLNTGKGFMNAMLPIPPEIADIIISIIIYFAATAKLIDLYMDKIIGFFRKILIKKGGGENVGNN